jgi:lysophospholipase L1-like esterase
VTAPLRIAVIGDSLTFTDATGPQLPDHPDLWPNVMAREVTRRTGREVALTVWARPSADAVDAWLALTRDRHLMFDVVGPADVVVVAVGSFDHAPRGIPPMVEHVLPRLRPTRLRHAVRRAVRAWHPWIVRARGVSGVRTPSRVFASRYGRVLDQARGLTMGRATCVALGPTSHRARQHGGRHPRRAESEARQLSLIADRGWTPVPVWTLVEPFADRLNPDGVHWPAEAHREVGMAVADAAASAVGRPDVTPPR